MAAVALLWLVVPSLLLLSGTSFWSTAADLIIFWWALFAIAGGALAFYLTKGYEAEVAGWRNDLAECEERSSRLLDASPYPILIVEEVEGRVAYANDAAARLVGAPDPSHIVGRPTGEVVQEDPTKQASLRVQALAVKGASPAVEDFIRPDGSRVELQSVVVPITRSGRRARCIIGVETAEYRLAEEALSESERRFRSAFEDAAIGMALMGADGSWLQVNGALCVMLGYSKDEMLSSKLQALALPEDSDADADLNRQMFEGKLQTFQRERRLVHKDGRTLWVWMSGSLVRDAEGRPLYAVVQVQDITAKKRAEEELRKYSSQLEIMVKQRTEELERTHALLLEAERLAAIGSMAAQVGHDLRNPLTAITTNIYLLEQSLPASQKAKLEGPLKLINSAVRHANKIVDDLVEYSRPSELKKARLSLRAVIADAVHDVPIPDNIRVHLKLSPDVSVYGDASSLRRVVQNLVANAVEAMPEGGRLQVHLDKVGEDAVITVSDTGTGMSEADIAKAFTPFFTTKARGLGMGLAIVKRLVEAHEGDVKLQSELGKGTVVTVKIPSAERVP